MLAKRPLAGGAFALGAQFANLLQVFLFARQLAAAGRERCSLFPLPGRQFLQFLFDRSLLLPQRRQLPGSVARSGRRTEFSGLLFFFITIVKSFLCVLQPLPG